MWQTQAWKQLGFLFNVNSFCFQWGSFWYSYAILLSFFIVKNPNSPFRTRKGLEWVNARVVSRPRAAELNTILAGLWELFWWLLFNLNSVCLFFKQLRKGKNTSMYQRLTRLLLSWLLMWWLLILLHCWSNEQHPVSFIWLKKWSWLQARSLALSVAQHVLMFVPTC